MVSLCLYTQELSEKVCFDLNTANIPTRYMIETASSATGKVGTQTVQTKYFFRKRWSELGLCLRLLLARPRYDKYVHVIDG